MSESWQEFAKRQSDYAVKLERQLATAERERAEWENAAGVYEAGMVRAERERDGWKHRAERAERVVEAAQVQCEAHGVWVQCGCTDFHCLHFSAYQGKCAVTEGAVRALDAAEGTP